MKRLVKILFIFLAIQITYGQKTDQPVDWEKSILKNPNLSEKEYKNSLTKYNFGPLWTDLDNSHVYGFIGKNYQRIRIKIISATQNENNSDTYIIKGKSMVENNICQFNGSIKITKIRNYKNLHWGVDDGYKNKGIKKQGILIAEYHFSEDRTCTHSGSFDGLLSSSWYIDKNGKLNYDDIRKYSDNYLNNQFVGTWKGYNSNVTKICIWGDYRVPLSGDLDGGAGEFSPIDKYLPYGWQSVRDAYFNNDSRARQDEERKWWK